MGAVIARRVAHLDDQGSADKSPLSAADGATPILVTIGPPDAAWETRFVKVLRFQGCSRLSAVLERDRGRYSARG